MSTQRTFTLDFNHGNSLVNVVVQKFEGSIHVSLSSPTTGPNLENLICAMKTPYSDMPSAASLFCSESVHCDEWATSVGQKLARRLKVQMLVSCSLSPQYDTLFPHIEIELLKLLIADADAHAKENANVKANANACVEKTTVAAPKD